MIPSSLIGVLVFLASIGPGYIWVIYGERRTPAPERTTLLEAAQLVIIGGLASTTAAAVVIPLSAWIGLIDTDRLAADAATYVLTEPARALGTILVALALSYGLAWLAARAWYRDKPPIYEIGYSGWHKILSDQDPHDTEKAPKGDRTPYVTIGLRDGTAISGVAYLSTVEPTNPEDRELVIGTPIYVRGAGDQVFRPASDQLVYVHGGDIVTLSVKYYAPPAT